VEARGEFKGEFEKPAGSGSFGGPGKRNSTNAEVDFIANSRVTVAVGRFLTPSLIRPPPNSTPGFIARATAPKRPARGHGRRSFHRGMNVRR